MLLFKNFLTKHPSSHAFFIVFLCAAFLFYKYVLQVYPSIITNQLMAEYHLSGAGLGNLVATFYYAYMIMQLFVGVMLDKWSTRTLTALAILLCAIGTIVFSQSGTAFTAGSARFVMGIGVAFSTVAYLKLAALWFPANRYALVSGLLATAVMAGAVFGQSPLSFLMTAIGWHTALLYVGYGGLLLALLFFLIVRDTPRANDYHLSSPPSLNWKAIGAVLRSKPNWLLTFYSGLAFSPLAILGGLWGNPFFQEVYHLNSTDAASLVSLVFIGLGIGSPILGALSDKLGNRWDVLFYSTLLGTICITWIIYVPHTPIWLTSLLLFGFGFFIGSFMLAFAIGKELNQIALIGTVIAMINASDAFLDAFTEPAIGKFLDWRSDGLVINGIHQFTGQDFRFALSILPLYLFLSLVCLILLKKEMVRNSV